jgi:para-nitrobenzyl esterase
VQRNITAFGGDPQRVTIIGQSVGSSCVSCLVASPLTRGLFQRAICESGGSVGPVGSAGGGSMQTLAQAHEAGIDFMNALGARSVAELRARSPQQIQLPRPEGYGSAAETAKANMRLRNSGWIIIDGYAIPTSVHEIFSKGRQNDVPMLTGANSHEGSTQPMVSTLEALEAECRARFGAQADKVLDFYGARSAASVQETGRLIIGHRNFNWQNWTTLRLHAQSARSPAFGYHFRRLPPFPPDARYADNTLENLGAFHTAEIPYAFDNLGARPWPWTAHDRALADTMSSYWTNFAANGDPNGAGLPPWPRYDAATDKIMIFGDTIGAGPVPDRDKLDFWDAIVAAERAASA